MKEMCDQHYVNIIYIDSLFQVVTSNLREELEARSVTDWYQGPT